MNKYFKIGELSRLYDIGTDTIRYYEDQGLIHPVRGENGYRLYRIQDIWRMNVIRDLRGLGFPVAKIREYLENRSIESTRTLLEEELALIEKQAKRLRRLKKNVQERLATMAEAAKENFGVVEEVRLPQRRCFQIDAVFATDEEMDLLMKRLVTEFRRDIFIIGNGEIGSRVSLAAMEQDDFHHYIAAFIIDEDATTKSPLAITLSYAIKATPVKPGTTSR